MKILIIFIFPSILISEASSEQFQSFNESEDESMGHYMLVCENNGFLQVGETYDYTNSKIYFVKTNSNGQMIWNREIYIRGQNLGNSVIELIDGYLICGGLNRNSALIKLDKQDGSTIFTKIFNNGGVNAF